MTDALAALDGVDDLLATMVAPGIPVTTEFAAQVAREYYGFEAAAERLTGERDENFRLRGGGADFVLKIAPAAEDPLITDLSTAALLHIERSDPGLPCPRVRRDRTGNTQIRFNDASGRTRTGRMLSWLPGVPQRSVAHSTTQRKASGRLAARLGKALRDFQHPASRRPLIWDLHQLPKLVYVLGEMPDFPRAGHVAGLIGQFATQIAPRLTRLRHQVIHNDLNDRNVLVDEENPAVVTGLIDYGDLVYTALIADLAILTAAQLSEKSTLREIVIELTSAYREVEPLAQAELEILPSLISARMIMGVVIPSWHKLRNPSGGHYSRVNPDFVSERLEILDAVLATDFGLR